jgi:hypothetical protein
MIKRVIAFELRLRSMIPLRSDLNRRVFWSSSARRVASGYDIDPSVLICSPRCLNAIPAIVWFGSGPTGYPDVTDISWLEQYPVYTKQAPASVMAENDPVRF